MNKPGATVECTITYLEMLTRPEYPRPSAPLGTPLALMAAENPPLWYFFQLYDTVGAGFEWTDQHNRPKAEVEAFIQDPKVTLFTLIRGGWPAGFFILDAREPGLSDLAYFGLVAEVRGLGLGKYLLQTAVHAGWDIEGTGRMTVNTNSLDHPRALALYQWAGFNVTRQEVKTRVLSKPPRKKK